ncbi:MAG: GntR family transcriptional regulator [Anaerolineae bacterium]|nr:GntR family transcriptional regulator [Gloeobacterales cyanobacterium ES-bin-313]
MKFRIQIQLDSDVPASTQLLSQLSFAIASGQYPSGYQLPSTRALAMQTGLHRNTVSKVYHQLEEWGFVDAQAGSGIYVRILGKQARNHFDQFPQATQAVQKSVSELLGLGCSLEQARELFLSEIDWRARCGAVVLVTAPARDLGIGELMRQELIQSLGIEVQVVPLEQLSQVLASTSASTVVTSRYFADQAEALAAEHSARVIPININPFTKEIDVIKNIPKDGCLGVVSLSSGALRVIEIIFHGLRGDDILVLTAQIEDVARLRAVIRSAQTIISDQASFEALKVAVDKMRPELIRPPQIMCADSYISSDSMAQLRRELNVM